MSTVRAAVPDGYRDAPCEACGCALFILIGEPADILCPRCQRDGEILAALEDGDPPPPPGRFPAVAMYADADLIDAMVKADDGRFDEGRWVGIDASNPEDPDMAHPTIPGIMLKTRAEMEAFLGEATAELLRRIDRRRRSERAA